MDNNDDEDLLNNSNSFLDKGFLNNDNFFFFNNFIPKEDNIFFGDDYQDFNEDNNHCISVKEEGDRFNNFELDPDDYPCLKNKTEVQKSQVKTKSTGLNSQADLSFLKKKKESDEIFENEMIEEEEEEINEFNNVIKGEIFEITKETKKEITKGRNSKFNMVEKKHNKYSQDNIVRKIKTKFFDVLLRYINGSVVEIEIENPKKNSKKILVSKPFLLKINQDTIKNIGVEKNLELFDSTLKDIFSRDISQKLKKHGLDKNKKIINKIYQENKQKRTIEILNMTFLQSLEHFIGSKYYSELNGLEKEYEKVINDLKQHETEEYILLFKETLKMFYEKYKNKRPRKAKKIE